MQKKILLVDGHSIANRAFYGIPILTNQEGQYTNAVYGFLNILISVIEEEKPAYLAVAFDLSGPTFRHKMFKAYKATRKGTPAELRPQIPLLKQVLDTMKIQRFEMEGYEADDILGTLARKSEEMGLLPVILSGDRDMLQIATDKTRIKIPRTRKGGTKVEEYYAKDVLETYGVTPLEYIDVKGLMGDTSDNIPGVPGIGEKTAIKLIKQYHSLDNVLKNIVNIKQKKLAENLETYKQQAIDSKALATVVTDMDLDINLENLTYELVLSPETVEIFQNLEFKSLLGRLEHGQEVYEQAEEANKNVDYILIDELSKLQTFIKDLERQEQFAYLCVFDQGKLCGFSICFNQEQSYWIEAKQSFSIEEIVTALKPIFENEETKKIGHDFKQDMHTLMDYGVDIASLEFDTMIAAYVLNPTSSSYDIDEIGHMFIAKTHESSESLLGKGKKAQSIFQLSKEKRVSWLCARVNIIYKAHIEMKKELEKHGQYDLFYKIEMPLIKVLFDMERTGIKIELDALKEYGQMIAYKIEHITKEIYDFAGEKFNINSPKQLGTILFEKLEIPPLKKTKTGYSTAADVLERLQKDYPIVDKVLTYRHLAKLKSTYVDGLFAVVNKETSKIHSTFNQTITATGRISSTEPNLQNIPIRFELGKKIRKVFVPSSKDYIFVDADYSQIELRILAHISGDPTLIDAFKHDQDIHKITASQVFNIPFEEVTELQRNNAKAVNFGIVYGISAYSLSEDLKITRKEAQQYIDGYFTKYPKVKAYLDHIVEFAKEKGYVETLFQRKRAIPEIRASNFNVRSFGERVAMNTPIQGSAADIIKLAMIQVDEVLKQNKMHSRLILTVHDELLIEAHQDELEKVKKIVKHEMEGAVKLSVPIDVDLSTGTTWYDLS